METVVMEMDAGHDHWVRLGAVCELEPPGSFSSEEPGGRQVYVFGWHADAGPAVWRSEGGVDIANDAVRVLASSGLEKIADLDGGAHTMSIRHGGISVPFRFRVESGA